MTNYIGFNLNLSTLPGPNYILLLLITLAAVHNKIIPWFMAINNCLV